MNSMIPCVRMVGQAKLEARAVRAAEEALADRHYVGAVDVLVGMRLLHPTHLEDWRKGRVDFLERVIQGNPDKIDLALAVFHRWALSRGLRPSETQYVRRARGVVVDLQFSQSGDPALEKFYRTHYVSPTLSEDRQRKVEEKLSRPDPPVVFRIVGDSRCSECGAELDQGSLLLMEAGQPLCLACAGLGDLEYLPAGDAALTRRSAKYSGRTAVVVRFSKSRGRYERQGILIESAALTRAAQDVRQPISTLPPDLKLYPQRASAGGSIQSPPDRVPTSPPRPAREPKRDSS